MNKQGLFKKVFIYASIAIFVLFVGLIMYGSSMENKDEDFVSYNAKPNGAKALYLLADEMGYEVDRNTKPARFWTDDTTFVLARPDISLFNEQLERKYFKIWLEKGNKLIIIDDQVNFPLYKINEMIVKPDVNLVNNNDYYEFNIGNGKIIFIEDSIGFTNEELKSYTAGIVFIQALEALNSKKVMFDEYYHGFGEAGYSLWDILGQSGRLVLIQIALAIVVLLLAVSRRFGKPVTVFEIIKRQENENLFAISNIYLKSRANNLVLDTHLKRFRKEISKYLGFNIVPQDSEIINVASSNKFLNEMNIKEVLFSSERYIRDNRKDTKELVEIIKKLEKIRKGIK